MFRHRQALHGKQTPCDGLRLGHQHPRRGVVRTEQSGRIAQLLIGLGKVARVDVPGLTRDGWLAPQGVDIVVDGDDEPWVEGLRPGGGHVLFQRDARTGDSVERSAVGGQPLAHPGCIRAQAATGRLERRPGPDGTVPDRREGVVRVVEWMHESPDNSCRIVDLSLEQLAGALSQPDQGAVRQQHMACHRQTSPQHGGQDALTHRGAVRGTADVDQEHDGRRQCRAQWHVPQPGHRVTDRQEHQRQHSGQDTGRMPQDGHRGRHHDAGGVTDNPADTTGVGVGGLGTQHHQDRQRNPVAVPHAGGPGQGRADAGRRGQPDRMPQDRRITRELAADRGTRGARGPHEPRSPQLVYAAGGCGAGEMQGARLGHLRPQTPAHLVDGSGQRLDGIVDSAQRELGPSARAEAGFGDRRQRVRARQQRVLYRRGRRLDA